MKYSYAATVPLLAVLWSAPAMGGDAANGQAIFRTQCGICHSVLLGKNLAGPSLFGLAGGKSGVVEGFRYSAANRDANIVWTTAALDKYLLSPREAIPGTTMVYPGLKDDEKRADLIAYLETLR